MTTQDMLLAQFSDEHGNIERRVMTRRWRVASRIKLVDDRLEWRWSRETDQLVEPGPGMLKGFVALRDANASDVLSYARRWGVLELCKHDLPASHPPYCWPPMATAQEAHLCPYDELGRLTPRALAFEAYREASDDYFRRLLQHREQGHDIESFKEEKPEAPRPPELPQDDPPTDFHLCLSRGSRAGTPWEPVSAWRTWAKRAYALLAIAGALREAKRGAEDDWRLAYGIEDQDASGPGSYRAPMTTDAGWRELEHLANRWLGAARVRPWLEMTGSSLQFKLGSDAGSSPLYGAIAIQLGLAVSGAEGFAVCDVCKSVYAPERKPRLNERHYCQQCRARKEPERIAAAEYRKRKKKGEK